MQTTKAAIIGDDQRVTQRIIQELNFLNFNIGEIIDKPRDAYLKIPPREPRVILLVQPQEEVPSAQVVTQIKKVNPTAPIIYVSKDAEFAHLRDLFRSGIFDILRFPDEVNDLEVLIKKAVQTLKGNLHRSELNKVSTIKSAGTVLAFYSGKGGCGTSLVAANLAHAMALKTNLKVLLIDLNLQFGSISTILNIKHDRNLGDLKPVIRELTESQIRNVLYQVESSGLQVLLSCNSPEEAEHFLGDDIDLLIGACRLYFDVIVLDVPKELNEVSISALNNSDHIFYTINLERPAIVQMQSTFDLLERYHLIKDDNVSLIVNKFSKKHDITIDELQRMSRFRVIGRIADDFKQLQSYVNLGQPWLKDQKDKGKRGPIRDLLSLTAETSKLIGVGGE